MATNQKKKQYTAEEKENFAARNKAEAEKNFNLAVRKDDAINAIYAYLKSDAVFKGILRAIGKNKQSLLEQCISGVRSVLQKAEPDHKGIALWHSTPASIGNAIRDSIQHGIPIDGRGLAYLVRYNMEVRFTPGYKGYINRVCEHNPTADFQVGLVFDGDDFSFYREDGVAHYKHNPKTIFPTKKDMVEKLIGAYCYISYTVDGKKLAHIEPMGRDDIDTIRKKAKTDNVWEEFTSEQIKKTVIRRACKVPFARVVQELDELDNDNYDMSKGESKPKSSAWDEALKKEKESMEKTVDGTATVVETKDIPSDDSATGGEASGNETSNEEEKPEEDGIGEWEGQLAIPFLPTEQMPVLAFNNPVEAAEELINVLLSTDSKKERSATIEANRELLGVLLKSGDKNAGRLIDECHKIEAEAENP